MLAFYQLIAMTRETVLADKEVTKIILEKTFDRNMVEFLLDFYQPLFQNGWNNTKDVKKIQNNSQL